MSWPDPEAEACDARSLDPGRRQPRGAKRSPMVSSVSLGSKLQPRRLGLIATACLPSAARLGACRDAGEAARHRRAPALAPPAAALPPVPRRRKRRPHDCRIPASLPIKATVPIVYLGKEYEEPLPLSYSEKIVIDKGIQGARLIIKEANQAGRFVGYAFELVEAIVPAECRRGGQGQGDPRQEATPSSSPISSRRISSPWPICPRPRTRSS